MAFNRLKPNEPLAPAGPPPAFEHYLSKVKMLGVIPKRFKIGKEFEMPVGPMTLIRTVKARIFQMMFEGGTPREGRNWNHNTLVMRLVRVPDIGPGEHLDDDRTIQDYNPPGINYGLPFNGNQLWMLLTMRVIVTTPKRRRFALNKEVSPAFMVCGLKGIVSTKVQELGGMLDEENMRITFMGKVLNDKWAILYDVGMGNNGNMVEVEIDAIGGGGEWEDGMPNDHEGETHPHDRVHCLSHQEGEMHPSRKGEKRKREGKNDGLGRSLR